MFPEREREAFKAMRQDLCQVCRAFVGWYERADANIGVVQAWQLKAKADLVQPTAPAKAA